ncbi:N-acetyltransferase [Pseudomonas sp. WS 5407]|nr:N-acetyltransferase [Pseudomonas sp. WS 5407]
MGPLLLSLSTIAGTEISNPSWVNFQSAGWVSFQSAPTHDRYPVLVMLDEHDKVIGWASLSDYRNRACYDGIADFSIYMSREVRGQGLGKNLLQALLKEAEARGFWKVLSRVFTSNRASLALCEACGFRQVGVYEKHACLDGRWIDCAIVERLIPTNQMPWLTPMAATKTESNGLSGC